MTNKFSKLITTINQTPILSKYYLILGAGKFGEVALSFVQSQEFPLILIIDKELTPTVDHFPKISNFANLLEMHSQKGTYFYQSDIDVISDSFHHGFPEYFIPAVPIHAVAHILNQIFQTLGLKVETTIHNEDWEKLLNTIPNDVLLSHNMENGLVLLSWAKEDEICPSNCPSPLDYCSPHDRKKPYTITEIAKNAKIDGIKNYIIESHQVNPGLGLIHGQELKSMILKCLRTIQKNIKINQKSCFMIATTCNCHGVINCFTCSSL